MRPVALNFCAMYAAMLRLRGIFATSVSALLSFRGRQTPQPVYWCRERLHLLHANAAAVKMILSPKGI